MTVHVALKDTFVSVSFPADLTCVGPYTSVHIDVLLVRNSVHKTLEINWSVTFGCSGVGQQGRLSASRACCQAMTTMTRTSGRQRLESHSYITLQAELRGLFNWVKLRGKNKTTPCHSENRHIWKISLKLPCEFPCASAKHALFQMETGRLGRRNFWLCGAPVRHRKENNRIGKKRKNAPLEELQHREHKWKCEKRPAVRFRSNQLSF